MELTYLEKQFILCTKGHFEKPINKYDDIKEIVAEEYALYPDKLEYYSLFQFVSNVFDKLINNGYILTQGYSASKYVINKIYNNNLQRDNDTLLQFMIGEISNVKVKGLDLGIADGEVLPLKKFY